MRALPRPDRWAALLGGLAAGALAAINFKVAIGVVLAAVVAILLLVGAEILLLGVVAVEPWTDALNFPTSTFTVPKILGILAIAAWALAALTGRTRLRFTAQMGWAFAFLFVVIVSLMLSPEPGGLTKTVSYALYVMFMGLFVQSIRTNRDAERCLAVYAAAIALGTFYGLSTFLRGGGHLASGPISDPNNYASTLAGALPLAIYFSVHATRAQWMWRMGTLLMVATMLATLSRGALVGFAVVVIWGLLSGRIAAPVILAGALTVVIGVGVGLIFFRPLVVEHLHEKTAIATTNVNSREAFWSAALRMAEDHPLFGVGPAGFGIDAPRYVINDPIVLNDPYTHNSYLEILAEDGILAIVLYLVFLASTWRALRTARRLAAQVGDRRGVNLADALMAGFLWTVVTMIFISRQLAIPVWLMSGIAGSIVLGRQAERIRLLPVPSRPSSTGSPSLGGSTSPTGLPSPAAR